MATASRAVERIADTMGRHPAPVARAARALRESDVSLWPQGAQGRGQAAHVEPDHLFNIVIASVVADPITAAPAVVQAFADLQVFYEFNTDRYSGPIADLLSEWKRASGTPDDFVFPGRTFKETIVSLIDWLGRPEGRALKEAWEKSGGFHVDLITEDGHDPEARISYFEKGSPRSGWASYADYIPAQLQSQSQVENMMLHHAGTVRRTLHLRYHLFDVLAELWTDTQNHKAASRRSGGGSKIKVSSEATPEASSETRAAVTGQGRLKAVALAGRSAGRS